MVKRRAALLACGILCASGSAAQAHPHVWVSMRSDIVFTDDGLIKGVNPRMGFR
jgi:ABC-type uncharacterized transport system substrate-binding protein